jgi:Ca2+-binding EF-hand superfamily protein
MNRSNNNMDEFTMRNMFRNFDIDNNGVLTELELSGLASKLGLEIDGNELQAVFKRIDTNNNGELEFDEFVRLMLQDPYK